MVMAPEVSSIVGEGESAPKHDKQINQFPLSCDENQTWNCCKQFVKASREAKERIRAPQDVKND